MLIETYHDLVAWCRDASSAPELFIDTEFIGEGRYYPMVGAIQVATRSEAVLVDPVRITNLDPLLELLARPDSVKVFHAASQDLGILYRMMDVPLAPVFDTQIAAALISSEEQIAFVNLVERITGQRLSKGHSFTNWLQRPLNEGQIQYALDDVRYLVPVYDEQKAKLEELDRAGWMREEMAAWERAETFEPTDPNEVYLRLRGVERLSGRVLAILQELAAWREETARNENIPLGRIARDEALIEMARRAPLEVKQLRDIRGLTGQQADRYGRDFIYAIAEGSRKPPVKPPPRLSFPFSLEPTVDFLVVCLRALCVEKSVASGMVATRSDLCRIAQKGLDADVSLTRGWRREAFGEPIMAVLDGCVTARVVPGKREVRLEWNGERTEVSPCDG
ncbi:MAG TPA: HRDC domain-containing protein [Armatimonadota bacterium]|nr:HRDC domain-containing protein [Armatimonadota bacterium]